MAPAAAALRQVGGDNDPVADKANKDLTAHSKGVVVVRGGRRVYERSLHKCCSVDLSPPRREWGGVLATSLVSLFNPPPPAATAYTPATITSCWAGFEPTEGSSEPRSM